MFRVTISDKNTRRTFLLKGKMGALTDLIARMEGDGKEVAFASCKNGEEIGLPQLLAVDELEALPQEPQCVWAVWNRRNKPEIQQEAQERGALCVLTAEVKVSGLLHALDHAITSVTPFTSGLPHSRSLKRHYARGEQIHLDEDRVVRILRGVVRCTSVHPDGSEVLIGFYGPRDVLMAHANYPCHSHSCFVEMRAHTSMAVAIEPWSIAVMQADFHERLKQRICQMELWSSMQARATVEERLLGILQVIGGRFSRPFAEGGAMLDLKLTHEQLASAVGATRTTVTRLLGALKKQGRLRTHRTKNGDFFVIHSQLEACHH